MIKRWKIANFKSIRDETELELAPLTIFAGANSSGKSTVLQSILLIAQTLEHKISSKSVVLNGSLSKLGQFNDLLSDGTDVSQISIGWHCEPIANVVKEINWVECKLSFDTDWDPLEEESGAYQLHPRLHRFQLNANLSGHDSINNNVSICVSSTDENHPVILRLDELKLDGYTSFEIDEWKRGLSIKIEIDDISLADIQETIPLITKITSRNFDHFLPKTLDVSRVSSLDIYREFFSIICDGSYDTQLFNRIIKGKLSTQLYEDIQEKVLIPAATIIEYIKSLDISDEIYLRFLRKKLESLSEKMLSLRSLADIIQKLPHRGNRKSIREVICDKDSLGEYGLAFMILKSRENIEWPPELDFAFDKDDSNTNNIRPKFLSSAMEYIDHFFSEQVRYLGPLRIEPRPFYPIGTLVDPESVGLRGEQTAAVLHMHRKTSVEYLPAANFPQANSELSEIMRTPVSKPLMEAVQDWANYFGVAGEVQTSDLGKSGHDLTVGLDGDISPRDLTHVGVGVSQVLPILVMGLLSKEDTTLIFEQPELHLHPLVQTRLADFFLSMALLKKQCIIETHSEHLINRLRFRAASASVEEPLTDISKIYFVEKKEGTSQFREVVVNEYGSIQDWPSGFFDQSYTEAENILMASIKKRKKMRKRKDK